MKILGYEVTRAGADPVRSLSSDPVLLSLMDKRASPENPAYSLSDPSILSAIGYESSPMKAVSPQRAMQTSAVFACVRILAESFAQLPVKVLERQSNGSTKTVTSLPLSTLLGVQPNSYQSAFQFREMGQSHCAMWGNFYAEMLKNRLGETVGFYPLNSSEVKPKLIGTEKFYDVNGITLRDEEVLHVPALGYNGLTGLSPIALHRTTIGMSLAAEEFGASFYNNGTRLAGVLEHPKALGEGAADRLRENWSNIYAGKQNAGRVAVLEEGMKFNALTMPLEDAQYIESRKFQVTDVARIYRVPPHMVGDLEKSAFTNIEQQSIDFVVHTMMPWVIRWEQEINRRCFAPGSNMFIKFNLAGLLRGDIKSRYEAYNIGRNGGWLCVNDIRELEDMNAIENGDIYLEPLNMKPAGSPDPAPAKDPKAKQDPKSTKDPKANPDEPADPEND